MATVCRPGAQSVANACKWRHPAVQYGVAAPFPERAGSGNDVSQGSCMTAPTQGRETRAGDSTPETNERAEGFLAQPKAGPGNPGGELTEPGGERPGAVIDRYVLLERLGEGGFGSVWS